VFLVCRFPAVVPLDSESRSVGKLSLNMFVLRFKGVGANVMGVADAVGASIVVDRDDDGGPIILRIIASMSLEDGSC